MFQELDDAAQEQARRDTSVALANRLRGWDVDFLQQARRFAQVRVKVVSQATREAFIFRREDTYWKNGDAERCVEALSGIGRQEWRILPTCTWQRWEQGPWKRAERVSRQGRVGDPDGESLIQSWRATPMRAAHLGGGLERVHLLFNDKHGYMEWIVEAGSGLVREMKSFDRDGHLVWEEVRQHRRHAGAAIVTERTTTAWGPPREVTVERLTWVFGPDAVAGAQCTAP